MVRVGGIEILVIIKLFIKSDRILLLTPENNDVTIRHRQIIKQNQFQVVW